MKPQKLRNTDLDNKKVNHIFKLGKSDQGGPVVTYNVNTRLTTQIGLLAGGAGGNCGSKDVPAIYMRLDHADILGFIKAYISN